MKTTTYNPGRIFLPLLIAGIFTLSSHAANKGHEYSAPNKEFEKSNSVEMSSSLKTEPLSEKIQDWMENGSYWEAPGSNTTTYSKLAEEMENWMSSGQYWSDTKENPQKMNQLSVTLKNWMQKGLYWNSEK